MKLELKIIISGFGGQGILSLGKIIARAAIKEKLHAAYMPSYGAEMRGGTANCKIIVSSGEIASPYINRPDVLIALNQPSLDKFKTKLKEESAVFINTSLIDKEYNLAAKKTFSFPFSQIAKDLGMEKAANIIVLGKLLKEIEFVKKETVIASIKEYFSGKGGIITRNLKAFREGQNL
ncbi:MAG: hypothetical protein B1H08_05585 [Candidatus Omnitrophica bacterium 4484_171]|nr:MAG: hypothetical protein B1H08_05585 [Candidatus Omnitrophica bacterium 4484_171]